MAERQDLEMERRPRADREAERVEQRDEDGHHESRLSESARNLNQRNACRVSGRHNLAPLDVARLVEAADAHGTIVAVDITTATGYLQQPLALGADFVVASDTKALTGHSDLVLGHVTAATAERATALRT